MGAADNNARLGVGHILVATNKAEVGEGDLAARVNDQVGGLDIAMDESGIMGDFETECDLFDYSDGLEFGDAFVGAQELIDVFAFKEFHGDVKDIVFGGSGVEDLDDVWAFELCDGEGFALKASDAGLVLLGVGEHDLEGDFALEGFLVGAKDSAHATASDLFFEQKGADFSPNHRGDGVFELFLFRHNHEGIGVMREKFLKGIEEQRRPKRALKDVCFAFLSELYEELFLVG